MGEPSRRSRETQRKQLSDLTQRVSRLEKLMLQKSLKEKMMEKLASENRKLKAALEELYSSSSFDKIGMPHGTRMQPQINVQNPWPSVAPDQLSNLYGDSQPQVNVQNPCQLSNLYGEMQEPPNIDVSGPVLNPSHPQSLDRQVNPMLLSHPRSSSIQGNPMLQPGFSSPRFPSSDQFPHLF